MTKKILLLALLFVSACSPPTTIAETVAAPKPSTATAEPVITVETALPAQTATPAFTPTLESIRISPNDGMTQLLIPAGTFIMGGLDIYRQDDELPPHEVVLPSFWIDQVEVTNGMYALCVQAGACRPPRDLRSDNREEYYENPDYRDYPVVNVAWYDANAYCIWANRRLPTEAEWERAARGDDKRNYPWGDELPNPYNSNSLNTVGDTTRVGSYAEGASPFGALDMAGNVWEWVADVYDGSYYQISPLENPQGPVAEDMFTVYRVIRGGAYQEDDIQLRVSNRSFLEGPDPKADAKKGEAFYGRSSNRIGFRCAQDD
ncbi:MAG: formylglycine-generating enzyme family protein [Chloroflexi bacterium]|nr:formylglycine-generating enzyme family protein [Chloroflexota bacterium]